MPRFHSYFGQDTVTVAQSYIFMYIHTDDIIVSNISILAFSPLPLRMVQKQVRHTSRPQRGPVRKRLSSGYTNNHVVVMTIPRPDAAKARNGHVLAHRTNRTTIRGAPSQLRRSGKSSGYGEAVAPT
jgi:hypothetical protein